MTQLYKNATSKPVLLYASFKNDEKILRIQMGGTLLSFQN